MEASYYSAYVDNSVLVAEGKWWKVIIHTDNQSSTSHWMNVEVIEGLMIPAPVPEEEKQIFKHAPGSNLEFDVQDTSVEDRMSDMTPSKCHHDRFSDMSLRSS
ncbi:hypothetical protein SK128_006597 [Halocaridina rubra]|uniref:Uncharacterized protein n=1 Tax=Halocaridina rubra TaxID=373956 RepID=A0AAN8WLQ8_HALRR